MTVCRLVDGITSRGGAVTHLHSSCGGLPSPTLADNPLGYKWSWSPRGALTAMNNGAAWLEEAQHCTLAQGGGRLLASATPFRLPTHPAYALEQLPNRDALPYATKYAVAGPALVSIRRGTLRFGGFCARMGLLAAVGLLSSAATPVPPALLGAASSSGEGAQVTVPLRALLAACAGMADPLNATPEALAEA